MRNNTENTYGSVAKGLHWTIAVLMLGLLAVGIYVMEFGGKSATIPLIPVHKAVGLIVLALVLFRLWWRARSVAPALPESVLEWQKKLSRAAHYLLYLCMLAMPISGWVMSSGAGRPVWFFGLFEIPPLPVDKAMGKTGALIHNNLWIAFLVLIGLHILAALIHHFYYRDTVLKRMLP